MEGTKELMSFSYPYLLLGNDYLIFQVKKWIKYSFQTTSTSFAMYIVDVTVSLSANLFKTRIK